MLYRLLPFLLCLSFAPDALAQSRRRTVAKRAPTATAAAEKPNFVVINIDDLGYADIGPFGSTLHRTPNLNRMAEEGMKLTCFYGAPVCSPSRAALMTGCYPKRVLPIPSVLFPGSQVGLHPDEQTVAELLKDAGYTTACIGKWHLGDQPEFLPTSQGFDYYYGIPYSNDMGPRSDGSKSDLGKPLLPPGEARKNRGAASRIAGNDETGLKGESQTPLPLLRNDKVIARVRAQEQTELVSRYTEEALKFIQENKSRKFFLYLPHNAVHFPLYPGKAFQGKSRNGLYGDWVEEVDWSVGRVLESLRELNLHQKTLVLFTSDNGGTARSVNAPLRGTKATTLEGGMRAPTIAWWPGRITPGSSSGVTTGMIDVLPTIVRLAGAKLPARKFDGTDITPILTSGATDGGHQEFLYYRGLKLEAVRQGPWKLHLAKTELFNLDSDVGESTNVAAHYPDIVAQLKALAEATRDDLGPDGEGPGVRPIGRAGTALPLIDHEGRPREGFGDSKTAL